MNGRSVGRGRHERVVPVEDVGEAAVGRGAEEGVSLHRIAAEPLAARVGLEVARRLREGDRRRQQVIVERVEQVVELRPEVVPVRLPERVSRSHVHG